MNVELKNLDTLNAQVKVTVSTPDYEEKVNIGLQDYRKKANIHGFRPGKVPMGVVKKMVGKHILVEEVNKVVMQNLYKYIVDQKINILGEPMISESQELLDFDTQTDFTFTFDLGLSPKIEMDLSKKDKIPYYQINVDDKMLENAHKYYTSQMGQYLPVDAVVDLEEMLKGDLKELGPIENPIIASDASLLLRVIKDEEIKTSFKGKKTGDKITFNIRKAYPNDTELSNLLNIPKEDAAKLTSDFELSIAEIRHFADAELNQELFDKAFGEGNVKSIEEFNARITSDLQVHLKQDSDYKMSLDLKSYLIKKSAIQLPELFLKRWLTAVNKGNLNVEEDYPKYEDELKWQVLKTHYAQVNKIEVSDDDLLNYAKEAALAQFRQYGMASIPDEHLTSFAQSTLQKEEERNKMHDRLMDSKTIEFLKELITLQEKPIGQEEFAKLFEEENK